MPPILGGIKKCHAKFLGIGLVICHEPSKKTDGGGGGGDEISHFFWRFEV